MIKKMFIHCVLMTMTLPIFLGIVHAKDPIGYVSSLKGEVIVTHGGESSGVALKLNDPVFLGDSLQTAKESKVQILMEDDSLLTLGELSSFTIKEHHYQPAKDLRSSVYRLVRGKVRVAVGKIFSDPKSRLGVETSTSVVGVRMTDFVVWVVSPELTLVIGIDGAVEARNIRTDMICKEIVEAGYQTEIEKDTCPTVPEETPQDIMEEILLETEVYITPQTGELPATSAILASSVQSALAISPDSLVVSEVDILQTGMMGTGKALAGESLIDASTNTGVDTQLNILQPQEGSKFSPPIQPPILPIPPLPPPFPPQ